MADGSKPISRRQRFEILRRDNYTCRYCGDQAPDVPLAVDHVVPRALGGGDDPTNLVTSCRDCNTGKGSTSPDEHIVAEVDARAEQWAQALKRAAEIRRAEMAENPGEAFLSAFYASWREILQSEWDMEPGDWESSILRFADHGLSIDDLREFMSYTARNLLNVRKPFRYFCRLCWNEIEHRRSIAESLMDEG